MGKFCVVLTDAQLIEAYERRKSATWPQGFAAAMADAVCNRLITLEAWCHERRKTAALIHRQQRSTSQPPQPLPIQAARPAHEGLDHKRRASGERDDD